MPLTWQEQQIIKDIEDGVGAAVAELGFRTEDLTSIKLNKLVYIALSEFYDESPVTYSWFKYGPSVGHQHVDPESVKVRPIDEISGQEARAGRNGEYRSPEEYAYLYLKDIDYIEEILDDNTKKYLKTFYQDYASRENERYKDLYVRSVDLQLIIDELYDSDFYFSNDTYSDVSQNLSGVGREVLSLPEVDESADPFTAYSDLLRDIILTCEKKYDDLSNTQRMVLTQAIGFYYSHAWRFPMLMVSEKTAVGPSRRDLTKATINDIESMERQFMTDLNMLQERCINAGLIADEFIVDPDWEDKLREGYSRVSKRNEALVEDWEAASVETLEYL